MNDAAAELRTLILRELRAVRRALGLDPLPDDGSLRFADALDSMGLVELLGRLADECGVEVEEVEHAAGRRLGTGEGLARDLAAAGWRRTPAGRFRASGEPSHSRGGPPTPGLTWLVSASAQLPARRQTAAELDVQLGRPPGWFEGHTGITGRGVWVEEDA